ncbi:hypothetical protein JX266_001421 [Neoarthrinium moseri]|nr:hypothetical protein JX266_001421 [Neoarthrinium moseri]
MRLINVRTLVIQEFGQSTPPYAILSHTWEEGEVSYQEFHKRAAKKKPGFLKISRFCREARQQGYDYGWVDTCCIDKTSSAELSEAINSMFRWYQNAELCLAYLSDVIHDDEQHIETQLKSSRWLTRGWTLQELLAPRQVLFYGAQWHFIGDRNLLAPAIRASTGISEHYLLQDTSSFFNKRSRILRVQGAAIAEKMSWAAGRKTTREEDVAYSLLGLCGITMPLLYGEGSQAFLRLQEEVIRRHFDPTLLAWGLPCIFNVYSAPSSAIDMLTGSIHPWSDPTPEEACWELPSGVLATSPTMFSSSNRIIAHKVALDWDLTSKGLRFKLPASEDDHPHLVLPCQLRDMPRYFLAVPLMRMENGLYGRADARIRLVDKRTWDRWLPQSLHLSTTGSNDKLSHRAEEKGVWLSSTQIQEFSSLLLPKNLSPPRNVYHWSRYGPSGSTPSHAWLFRRVEAKGGFVFVILITQAQQTSKFLSTRSIDITLRLLIRDAFSHLIELMMAENLLPRCSSSYRYRDDVCLYLTRTKALGYTSLPLGTEEHILSSSHRKGEDYILSKKPKHLWSRVGPPLQALRYVLRKPHFTKRSPAVFMDDPFHSVIYRALPEILAVSMIAAVSSVMLVVCFPTACTFLLKVVHRINAKHHGMRGFSARVDRPELALAMSRCLYTIAVAYETLPRATYLVPTSSGAIRSYRLLISLVVSIPILFIIFSRDSPKMDTVVCYVMWYTAVSTSDRFDGVGHWLLLRSVPCMVFNAYNLIMPHGTTGLILPIPFLYPDKYNHWMALLSSQPFSRKVSKNWCYLGLIFLGDLLDVYVCFLLWMRES